MTVTLNFTNYVKLKAKDLYKNVCQNYREYLRVKKCAQENAKIIHICQRGGNEDNTGIFKCYLKFRNSFVENEQLQGWSLKRFDAELITNSVTSRKNSNKMYYERWKSTLAFSALAISWILKTVATQRDSFKGSWICKQGFPSLALRSNAVNMIFRFLKFVSFATMKSCKI